MATKQQVESFINTIAPIAQRQAKKHSNKIFPSVCIAQACCESAFGTSPKMIRANAVFGIKVGSSKAHFGTAWKDKAYSTKTKECYDGKNYTTITDMFRAYDSLEDAVEDYFDLLCTAKRYQHALYQPTPQACIEGIQKAPYATSPTYVSTIMNIITKYNLTQYDNISATIIPVDLSDKDIRRVTATQLNARVKMVDGSKLFVLDKGEQVHVVEEKDGWCRIEAWVSSKYLEK